jgi:hypothetical protein
MCWVVRFQFWTNFDSNQTSSFFLPFLYVYFLKNKTESQRRCLILCHHLSSMCRGFLQGKKKCNKSTTKKLLSLHGSEESDWWLEAPTWNLMVGVSKSGSVRFLHKKINQTDIINFKILKPKPNRNRFKPTGFGSVRFGFCCSKTGKTKKKISVPSVHKLQANLQANLSFCCSRKQICPVPTNYKQISISVVQEHKSTHKLQANYNLIIIIKKKQKPTRCRLQR